MKKLFGLVGKMALIVLLIGKMGAGEIEVGKMALTQRDCQSDREAKAKAQASEARNRLLKAAK